MDAELLPTKVNRGHNSSIEKVVISEIELGLPFIHIIISISIEFRCDMFFF
jgi:hypothetical protein